jgi:hypothetical protein
MTLDPKVLNAIRLITQHTRGPLAGPIKPVWLSLALPKVGKHRAWIDHVVEGLLCELINAYRVSRTRPEPFWRGPAYQVHRKKLSLRLDCRLRDISTALGFLEELQLVWLVRKARYVDGEPRGTLVYAIPNVVAIADMLAKVERAARGLGQHSDDNGNLEQTDDPKAPDSGTQGVKLWHTGSAKSCTQDGGVQHDSLNVPKQRNAAIGRSAERVATTYPLAGHERGAAARGGNGEADAAESDTSPHPATETGGSGTSPASLSRDGQRAEGPPSAAPSDSYPSAEDQAATFIHYWTEAGRRSGYLDLIHVLKSDRQALVDFFAKNDVDCGWLAAVAINSWRACANVERRDGYDTAWACRRSKDIQTFLRLRSKILNELGANRYKVNAYKTLRRLFTDTELHRQGFDVHSGLEVVRADRCWENAGDAPGYYEDNGLESPPEVSAALADRQAADTDDDVDHGP